MFTEFEQSLLRLWHDMRRPRQDFVWGVHFFVKNVDDLFLLVASKDGLKLLKSTTPTSKYPKKMSHKIDFCSTWGALTNFPRKLHLKNFFSALRVQVHPLHH